MAGSNSVAPNATTAAALIAANPNVVGILFNQKLRRNGAVMNNPFAGMVAMGEHGKTANGLSGAPVSVVTDFSKGGGMVVRFTSVRGLNTAPVLGESALQGNENGIRLGDYSVRVDYVRNGAAISRKSFAAMAAGGNLLEALAANVDSLHGRQQADFIWQRLRERTTSGINLLYPSTTRTTIATMTTADTASTDLIDRGARWLRSIGGRPISNRNLRNKAPVSSYLWIGPTACLAALYSDTSYSNASIYSDVRGADNIQFSGGFINWRGHSVYHVDIINEDTMGPIGSYFNPEARLGEAISAGTAAVTLRGGGSGYESGYTPAIDYFRYFPGGSSIGKQSEEETRSSDTGDYFIKVIDPAQSNKWAFYRYVGNDNAGTSITTAAYSATTGRKGGRLGGTANGGGADTRDTTCGTVAWDANKNIENPGVGSHMYLANAAGVIYGYLGCLGSDAVLVGKGGGAGGVQNASYSAAMTKGLTRAIESIAGVSASAMEAADDYGMKMAVATEAIFGVDCPKNSFGQYTQHLLVPVAYTPPIGSGA